MYIIHALDAPAPATGTFLNGFINTAVIVSLVVSVVIPLVSSLLSRTHWPSEVTGLITLALSCANGFFTEWNEAGSEHFDWRAGLALAVQSFIVAALARGALWRGTKTDEKVLALGSRKP